jgi:hypothetical protein
VPTKRLLTLLLAALLALTAAGCSDDDGDDQDAGDTAESVVDEAEEGAEDAASTASSAAEETATDAAEAAVRTIAKEQGEEEFAANDVELDSDLSCEATAQDEDVSTIDVECTGTTADGGEAVLSGTTSEAPGASATELEGDFTGTVDGDEVFSTDTLGDEDDADDGSADDSDSGSDPDGDSGSDSGSDSDSGG